MKITQKGYIKVPNKIADELDYKKEKDFISFKRGCSFGYVPWFNLKEDCSQLDKFLKDLEKTSDEEISEIGSEILYRQFYHGDDNIVDRVGAQHVKVKGTKEILEKVNAMIEPKNKLWSEGEFGEFFKEIAKILKVNPSVVINDFLAKIERDNKMGGSAISSLNSGSVFALAMGKMFINFHEKVHDEFVYNLIQYNFGFKNCNAFHKRWNEISAKLSTEHSLLLNLQILTELGTIAGQIVDDEIKNKKIEILIDQIKNQKKTPSKKKAKKESSQLPGLPSFP